MLDAFIINSITNDTNSKGEEYRPSLSIPEIKDYPPEKKTEKRSTVIQWNIDGSEEE